MATSPPPPFSTALPNTKKRPSLSAQSTTYNASKRPKLHPLRQTSFPVTQDLNGLYGSAVTSARSETGSIANSLLSGVSNKVPGRGRGRPRKSAQLNDDDIRSSQAYMGDGGSQADGSTKYAGRGTKSVISARSGGADADDDDEGDIDGMLANMDEQERKQAEEEESRQEQRRDRLTGTFNEDQYNRYSAWRALTLSKGMVKKMVNSIVSQSVTQAPLQAVNIYGKFFVGEILERARDVQIEFAKAYDGTRIAEKKAREAELQSLQEKQKDGKLNEQESRLLARQILSLKKEIGEYMPNPHRGGLLPDHLREALRRYKADGEGGGVGFHGMSHGLLGVQGTATWKVGDGTVGKRIFR